MRKEKCVPPIHQPGCKHKFDGIKIPAKKRPIDPNTGEKMYPRRTARQNRAMHLLFRFIADSLNDAGLDMRKVLKPGIEIPWTSKMVKEYLWRPIQKVQLGKESTTELTTEEIDKVFDTLNRHMAKFGVHEPFPSIETLMEKERERDELL